MATKTVSVVTGGTNSATVTAEEINAQRTDYFSTGIVGAITLNTGSGGSGGYAVNAQGTPNMTVRVSAGTAVVAGMPTGGNSQNVRVVMTSFEDVTIAANSSGSTKYDWVYISLDATKLANPAANKDDIATLVTSRSSLSTSDNGTPPTFGYCLGVVTVANAAASITNSNITDSRVRSGANAISSTISIPSTATVSSAAFTNPYKFSAYQAAAFALVANTWTKAQLNTELFDTGNNFDSTTNYRFVAPVAGFYQINAQIGISTSGASAGANMDGALYKNGSALVYGTTLNGSGAFTQINRPHMGGLFQLAANDYIELYGRCGEVRNIDGAGPTGLVTYMTGYLVSAT